MNPQKGELLKKKKGYLPCIYTAMKVTTPKQLKLCPVKHKFSFLTAACAQSAEP